VQFVRKAREAGLAEEEIVDLVRGAMGGEPVTASAG
jgi:hypothetical protein